MICYSQFECFYFIQYVEDNTDDVMHFLGGYSPEKNDDGTISYLSTLNDLRASININEYIVQDPKGHIGIYSESDFNKQYYIDYSR